MVEVCSETLVRCPRRTVAEFASDPDNAPRWYLNIRSVEWKTAKPLRLGSRISFVARFMGRRLEYVYEVVELEWGSRLVMRTSQGPFPMETEYQWEDAGGESTLMVLRNRGNPSGLLRLWMPLVAAAMRRQNRKDLQRLKEILEAS